jgi:hypothetical protein
MLMSDLHNRLSESLFEVGYEVQQKHLLLAAAAQSVLRLAVSCSPRLVHAMLCCLLQRPVPATPPVGHKHVESTK